MIRSLYLPPIIFWNAATGHPQTGAEFAFAMTSSQRAPINFEQESRRYPVV
jgi:hypothetical protein